MLRRVEATRRYQPIPEGWKALVALLVLRNKAIQPLLAGTSPMRPARGAQNPTAIDRHYETVRVAMQGLFRELGLAA